MEDTMRYLILALLFAFTAFPTTAGAADKIVLNQAAPHYGDTVNFTIQGVPARPYVNLICRQGGNIVLAMTNAYWDSYTRDFTLASEPDGTGNGYGWTGGAGSCHASVWNFGTGNPHELAALDFDVAA